MTGISAVANCQKQQEKEKEYIQQSWQQAVEKTLTELPGIGPKRKELFIEYLKENLKKAGVCIE